MIGSLVTLAAPRMVALPGVDPESAGRLLTNAGTTPACAEAAFARLRRAAPVPAPSGRTNRHRLDRGGDRAANNALHTIALVGMECDQCTQEYGARRTPEGMRRPGPGYTQKPEGTPNVRVAKQADALDSGSSARKGVAFRLPLAQQGRATRRLCAGDGRHGHRET